MVVGVSRFAPGMFQEHGIEESRGVTMGVGYWSDCLRYDLL